MLGQKRTAQTVAIIGLGDTGVLVASRLVKQFKVIGITTKPNLVSGQELGKRLTDLPWWRVHYNTPLKRFLGLSAVEIIQAKAEWVNPEQRSVRIRLPDGLDSIIHYDYLVIASGTSNGFWRDDSIRSQKEIDDALQEDAARIEAAKTIAVVGGGPCGVSCALNIRRTDPSKQVTLYFSGDQPLVGYHPTAQDYYDKLLKDAGVTLQNNDRAIVPAVTPASGLINFESGASAEAETILWTVGRRKPHTQFLPTELLDAEGFVKTQPTLEVEGSDTIFAIGDVASTDPDRSSARNWAYGVLVNNIKRKAEGKRIKQFYKPPPNRWGSIVGPQADGLTLHQHTGKRVRLSRWLVDNVLLPTVVQRMIYLGVARSVD